ncbi:SRPBCC family protein [Vitiosangium sp. GDMCC 1.1324]|uniref:SRPBCC family protein n=1 Tax=Vitiosangium sp. (strain GDMCC 1.1324) TaxID=2138576 RepID=UPI000D3489DE|nr:SRPBCC family protein [Vitiosangium sp. GDMCC 1.1324]PTL78820.1 hypothetical protein DAT35_37825 [Vitiosangium sp. GDMCC 1.1324]
MPTLTFEQSFDVTAPVEAVRAFLADPHCFPKIHPLIARITVTGERREAEVRVVEFEALELVPMLGLQFRNRLRCETFDDPAHPNRVRSRAFSVPAVTVDSTYTLSSAPMGCRASQRLALTAPWGLMSFVHRTAVAAHTRQGAAIRAFFAQ